MKQNDEYLIKNYVGIFMFKRRIPKDLQPIVERTYFCRSLRTRDIRDARRLCSIYAVTTDRAFRDLRKKYQMKEKDDYEFLMQSVARSKHEIKIGRLERFADNSLVVEALEMDPNNIEAELKAYDHICNSTPSIPTPPPGAPFSIPLSGQSTAQAQHPATNISIALRDPERTCRFTEFIEQFFQKQINEGIWKTSTIKKSIRDHKATFALFTEFYGNLNLHEYTPKMADNFKNRLFKIPKQWKFNSELSVLPYEEAIAVNKPKLSKTTINGHLSKMHSFFDYATTPLGYSDKNIFDKIQVPKAESDRTRWSELELEILFAEQNFLKFQSEGRPSRYWAPLIAAYTSLRVGEIFLLTVRDIYQQNNIWLINTNFTGNKSLKTINADRVIPINPFLIKCGFLEWVDERRKDTEDNRLFKEYLQNEDGESTGKNFSAAFGSWIRRTKASLSEDQKFDCDGEELFPIGRGMHSFRHLFVHMSDEAEIGYDMIKQVVGHSRKDITKHYRGTASTKRQNANLAKLTENLEKIEMVSYFPKIRPYAELMELRGLNI